VVDSLLLILPGVIWGASFLFIAEGLEALGPNGVTFVRILVGFLTLSMIPAARGPLARSDRAATAALGVLWLAFPLSMFPFAEQHVSSALTGMLNGATALFAAAVASILARRMPSRLILAGLAVGLLGAVLIALPGISSGGGSRDQTKGVLLIVAALISYGIAVNLARPLQQRNGALPVIWRALGVSVLLTAPFGVPAVLNAHWTPRAAAALLALGAFGTAVAHVLTATAAGRIGATAASATAFLTPVVALALGVGVRHEQVAWLSIVGAAVCLAGAWMIRQGQLADGRAATPAQAKATVQNARTCAIR
jgi:drug/metabolite transporter (DMT)-like permease